MTAQIAQFAIPAILSMIQGSMGKGGETSSTYSKGARSLIDDIIGSVKGMKGSQDITQNQNYQTGQDWLQSMFSDPEFFNKFEAPITRQFEEQTMPGIANRFASMGSGGATGSTAFRNQANRAGVDLATNLASMRGGMQQGAIPQMLNYAQQPFNNYMSMMQNALTPTQNVYQPPSAGPLAGPLSAITGAMSQGFGQNFGQSQGQYPGTSASGGGGGGGGYGAGWDSMFRQQGVY
jgi:hypothetical protein